MKFLNEKEPKRIRQKAAIGYIWKTVKTGQTIDLPDNVGFAYGLTPVKETEGKASDKKVETKQFEEIKKKENWAEKLQSIKGVGKKTAEDILKVYPTEEALKSAILRDEELPFRDDIAKLLVDHYGSKK